jgi:hypothetical protein
MSVKYSTLSVASIVLALLSLNCGGGSSMTNTSNNAPPPTIPPPSSSSPGGASGGSSSPGNGSPSGTGNPGSDSYMASIFAVSSDGSTASAAAPSLGTVTADDNGNDGRGTLKITGGKPNTSYELRFCSTSDSQPTGSCTSITNYTTDANGSANVTFQVPPGPSWNSGYQVGSFYVCNNGAPVYVGGANAQVAGASFRAVLLPQLPQPPPGGGSVSVSGQTLHVALSGVPASMGYEVLLCSPTPAGRRCNSFGTNTVDVDGQGNGAKDFQLPNSTFIGFVLVKNHLGQDYVSGFRVQ